MVLLQKRAGLGERCIFVLSALGDIKSYPNPDLTYGSIYTTTISFNPFKTKDTEKDFPRSLYYCPGTGQTRKLASTMYQINTENEVRTVKVKLRAGASSGPHNHSQGQAQSFSITRTLNSLFGLRSMRFGFSVA